MGLVVVDVTIIRPPMVSVMARPSTLNEVYAVLRTFRLRHNWLPLDSGSVLYTYSCSTSSDGPVAMPTVNFYKLTIKTPCQCTTSSCHWFEGIRP